MKKVPYTLEQINHIWRTEWPMLLENLQAAQNVQVKDIKTQFEKIDKINQVLDRMKEIVNMVPSDLYKEPPSEEIMPGVKRAKIESMWPDLDVNAG